ncbi:MAG: two-component system NtrC family sensor kinase, partial [Planctomycetota bacterium]
TTRDVGDGTGVGLSIVHDIVVNRLGGQIDFTTELGKGTTFTVRLPTNGEN